MAGRRLMAVLAHPDDESLGFGGTLARYASDGVHVSLVTATRGERGRYRGIRPGESGHPGEHALAGIRELELRRAAGALGVRDVTVLDYGDQRLDGADPGRVIGDIVAQVRRSRPHVVLTFGPDGAYGHPDHIAVSQFTAASLVAAADPAFVPSGGASRLAPHAVTKLYYLAWPRAAWDAYEAAFARLGATVDGIDRCAVPWPDWAITTVIDTRGVASTVWKAVECHASQVSAYARLSGLAAHQRAALWSRQSFYRAVSTVNGGRHVETNLFEGIES